MIYVIFLARAQTMFLVGDQRVCILINLNIKAKFKANSKNVNPLTQFCLGSISNGFGATVCKEVFLKENVYDFSVDYHAIDKSDLLNIHKYLMVKNIIKQIFFGLLSFSTFLATKCMSFR